MAMEKFGRIEGEDVFEITLKLPTGFTAKVINWGAVLRDLIVPTPSGAQHVVLGLNNLDDYRAYSPNFGSTPGRFANRIGDARFSIDGKTFQITPNKGSKHSLHGGPNGFGKRVWRVGEVTPTSVALHFHSPNGDAGFPGNAEVTCVYSLAPDHSLNIDLTATSDAPTPMNLTHHSYFNLDGSPDARDHEVQIFADFYTPTDPDLIPTGEIRSVDGSDYDFRQQRPIRNAVGLVYDTNFVARTFPDAASGLAYLASLHSPKNGLIMKVFSNQPGIQFYDGAKINVPVEGLDGVHYSSFSGLCFEPQNFPDAPNKRHFPSATLRPGEIYSHKIVYAFQV